MMTNVNFSVLFLSIFLLSACTLPGMSPVAQIDQAQHQFLPSPAVETRQVVKEKSGQEYLCQNKRIVRVQAIDKKTINVTLGQTTHKLSSTVTKNHKRYSNIRWIWIENFDGEGILKNSRNKVLAYGCVRK